MMKLTERVTCHPLTLMVIARQPHLVKVSELTLLGGRVVVPLLTAGSCKALVTALTRG